MSEISVSMSLAVSDNLCKDFLTTCVEGGSAYWLAAQRIERDPDLTVNKIVGCEDTEDGETKWGDATVETMREGIRRILSGEVKVGAHIRRDVLSAVTDTENTDWDAETADCVLQAGLLNDIVYG